MINASHHRRADGLCTGRLPPLIATMRASRLATFTEDDATKGPPMSGSWGSVLTELIPLALVVALSPLSIIPAVLVLHTPRPRPTGLAFLAGWLFGLAVLTAIFLEVSSLAGGLRDKPPTWASWLRIVVGAALIVFGLYRWFTRKRSAAHAGLDEQHEQAHARSRDPDSSGALTVAQPEGALHLCRSGFGDRHRGTRASPGRGSPSLWYVLVASSTVAIPILAYAVAGDRLDEPLTRLKDWMERQHATLVAAILIVIGLLVLYKGIHGL